MTKDGILTKWPRIQSLAEEMTRRGIVLTGARQTGKTSTFRHLFPDYAFVSLDLPTEAEQAEKEPERFLQRNPPGRVFAERFRRASTSRGIHICKIYDTIAYFARTRQLGVMKLPASIAAINRSCTIEVYISNRL